MVTAFKFLSNGPVVQEVLVSFFRKVEATLSWAMKFSVPAKVQ